MRFFGDYDLRRILESQQQKMKERMDRYSNDEIMANSIELLADNCFEQFKVDPIIIGEEEFNKRSIVQQKVQRRDIFYKEYIEVDGIESKFYFPYTGDEILFKCQASTFSISGYPDAELSNNFLIFTYYFALNELQSENDKNKIFNQLESDFKSIKSGVDHANADVNSFNSNLRNVALKMLTDRKKKVEQFYSISQMFEVPLQKSEFAITHIPMQRKLVPIAKKYNDEQAYCIADSEYKFILETIKHNGSTYERTPSSYKAMHEEDLRNTLLAALNGMYQGSATGEAFRGKGKTDICIEKDNRAAFVAECKMWTGPGAVKDAVIQLDSYLTWRDCKTALIFFVRNKDFLRVLVSVKQALETIPEVRQIKEIDRNEFECCLVSTTNPGQLVNIRVMLFNLYAE